MIVHISGVPVFPSVAVAISFFNFVDVPNNTLSASYMLLDAKSNGLAGGTVSLTSGQYTSWGGTVDDNVYLPTCYCANLGLGITGFF